jgi:hypothetical protein
LYAASRLLRSTLEIEQIVKFLQSERGARKERTVSLNRADHLEVVNMTASKADREMNRRPPMRREAPS